MYLLKILGKKGYSSFFPRIFKRYIELPFLEVAIGPIAYSIGYRGPWNLRSGKIRFFQKHILSKIGMFLKKVALGGNTVLYSMSHTVWYKCKYRKERFYLYKHLLQSKCWYWGTIFFEYTVKIKCRKFRSIFCLGIILWRYENFMARLVLIYKKIPICLKTMWNVWFRIFSFFDFDL